MSFSSRRQRSQGHQTRTPRFDAANAGEALFRRSRTLTGSVSSRIVSAVESTSHLKSSRLEEHELRGHRRRIGRLLAICLVAVGGCVWLIDSLIVTIQPTDAASRRYTTQVDTYLNAHPLERLAPFLDQSMLLAVMRHDSPELSAIEVRGDTGFAQHSLSTTERVPVAKWQLGAKLYYVDKDGIAFEHAEFVPRELVSIKDESGLPVEAQQVASRRTMQFIGQVVAQVKAMSLGEVQEVILPPGLLKEIDITLKDRPYRVKLHVDREPSRQVADLRSALGAVEQQGIVPQYLDLRVEGKAYYTE